EGATTLFGGHSGRTFAASRSLGPFAPVLQRAAPRYAAPRRHRSPRSQAGVAAQETIRARPTLVRTEWQAPVVEGLYPEWARDLTFWKPVQLVRRWSSRTSY